MYITLYYIVTRLPDSLRVVRDHFLARVELAGEVEVAVEAAEGVGVAVGVVAGVEVSVAAVEAEAAEAAAVLAEAAVVAEVEEAVVEEVAVVAASG
ncbi:unnamed protein product [Closterium sp. NIES-64]|nr:unnamed protein product [Closterium sp. NIES-64]